MRHGWTALSEKDKGPIFVHFRAMRHAWQVLHGLSGDFPDVGMSKFVSIIGLAVEGIPVLHRGGA